MKIAYMLPGLGNISGARNGILVQALLWAEELRKLDVQVDLVNPWDGYDFDNCDIIHVFSYMPMQERYFSALKSKFTAKIAVSPIIDSNRPCWMSNLVSRVHIPRLRLYSLQGSLRSSVPYVDGWFVRSDYEGSHVRAIGADDKHIFKVMLPTRFTGDSLDVKREDFCLFVGFITDQRKNVLRLIEAAIKYKFRLVLAGTLNAPVVETKIRSKVKGHDNIEILGPVSDARLQELYAKARVFALPSLFEGVGLVALEAAANGCDIVITNRGAPKEYYDGLAELVDPLSVDQIGSAIKSCIDGRTCQPQLKNHVLSNYSLSRTVDCLLSDYNKILGR